jgi:tetratricopeptide (TPR) repeat protein
VAVEDLGQERAVAGADDPGARADGPASGRNEFTAAAEVGTVVQIAGNVYGGVNPVPLPRAETPRQTPAQPVAFVDRADLLAWLGGLLSDVGVPPRMVVLTGPPGVGRRATVRRFAHDSRDRFPGGDLYVDCAVFGAATGDGAADVSGMVASCLRGLGVDDGHMPHALAERVSRFRTRTAVRPVLVVLENVTEPAQVRALLPNSPGSVVLVTTGVDLGELRLDGAVFREVGRLDEVSGRELFEQISGRRPGEVGVRTGADLVRFCAGLPIAILVLAARVAALHGMTHEELEDELADDRRRLSALSLGGKQIVTAAFTASYVRLPEEAQHLYRRVGLLPGAEVTPEVAAVVAAVDVETARRLLAALADGYLLERRAAGRFGFHELVRLHARELAQQEPREHREAALHQVVRHYLVRAAFADRAVMGARTRIADHDVLLAGQGDPFAGPDAAKAALAWLEGERANLVAVVRAAFDQGWDVETWQLAEALTGYYLNHRYLTDWTTTSDLGARAARHCGNVRAEARLRTVVSRAYTNLGDLERAAAELDAAIELAERSDDLVLQASAWEFRGRYLDRADPAAALAAYERAHELNVRAGEWRGVALVLYFEGRTLDALEQPQEALELFRRALDMLHWLGDSRMAARLLIAIGAAYVRLQRTQEAVTILSEAVRELEGRHYEAEARELLAGVAEQAGDHDGARGHLRRAWEIYRAGGHPRADELAELLGPEQQ